MDHQSSDNSCSCLRDERFYLLHKQIQCFPTCCQDSGSFFSFLSILFLASLKFCTGLKIKKRERKGGLKESWTFVLSMNCERANELFQPLSTAFTDIPLRLHTQITCTMEAARRAWASQRSLAPNTSVYNQERVGEKVGVEGVCMKSNVL